MQFTTASSSQFIPLIEKGKAKQIKMTISFPSISFFFASTIFLLLCSGDVEIVESTSRLDPLYYYFEFHNTLIHGEKALNKPPSSLTPPLPPLELNLRRKSTPKTFAAESPLPRLYPRRWTSIMPTTLGTDSPSPLRLPRLYPQPWPSVTPTTQGTDSPLSPLPLQRLYQQPWPSVTETFGWFISSRILSQQQWLISSPSSSESVPDGSESGSGSGSQSGGAFPASRVVVITGLSVALFVLLALGLSFICYNRRRQHGGPGGTPDDVPQEVSLPVMSNPPSKNAQSVKSATLYYSPATTASPARVTDPENPIPQPSSTTVHDFGLKVFKYRGLRKATDGFSKTNCLGEGGFGAVFKGVLPDGKIVAVKLLKNENFKGDIDFRTEVNAISCAIHRHIVSLIGYCIHADKRLIVFEFVANNSLHHYLHGGDKVQVLDWAKRVKIALGTAKGLVYLHEDCPRKIIHRDVKPANILLDDNFQAKVADFGIAKLCSDSFVSHLFTGPVGTTGYVDPEYFQTGKLTVKSDVYSFGVVLLELVSGCRPPTVHELVIKLPNALKKRNFNTLADPGLQKSYDTREMTLMVACADACLRKEPNDRPLMKQIAQVLEGIISVDELKRGTKGESCFCFERSKF